jgi:hypothetical protein
VVWLRVTPFAPVLLGGDGAVDRGGDALPLGVAVPDADGARPAVVVVPTSV